MLWADSAVCANIELSPVSFRIKKPLYSTQYLKYAGIWRRFLMAFLVFVSHSQRILPRKYDKSFRYPLRIGLSKVFLLFSHSLRYAHEIYDHYKVYFPNRFSNNGFLLIGWPAELVARKIVVFCSELWFFLALSHIYLCCWMIPSCRHKKISPYGDGTE